LLVSGHSTEELVEAHAQDRLALLPITDALREDGSDSLAEIAQRYDVPSDDLARLRRASGLTVSPDAVYGTSLGRYAAQLRRALDAGLDVDTLVTFNHVVGAAAASVAAAARDAMRVLLLDIDPEGSEHSRAVRGAELSHALMPTVGEVLLVTLEEHLRQLAKRELTASLVVSHVEPLVDVSIAFADLVGYTALGDTMRADRLGEVSRQLVHAARTALSGQAQLIKTLGDGVMICSRSKSDLLNTALSLSASAADAGLPELRIGVAHGPALARAGDWYGSVVNRASRLAALAEPGNLMAEAAAREAVPDSVGPWQDRGEVAVRGFANPIRCFSLRLRTP
jgi:adenylate cyclase